LSSVSAASQSHAIARTRMLKPRRRSAHDHGEAGRDGMVPERELREEGRVVIWLCSMESAYVPSEHTAHVAACCALLQPINLEPQSESRAHPP
jgi:hypothetical protein